MDHTRLRVAGIKATFPRLKILVKRRAIFWTFELR